MPGLCEIRFLPDDCRVQVEPGTILAEAALRADVHVEQPCGGHGRCGKCRVRFSDHAPPPTEAERDSLSAADLDRGWRLACRCRLPDGKRTVEVPPPSRAVSGKTFGPADLMAGDFERAVERYINAANLAPNDYRMWGNLGDAYHFQGTQEQVAEVAYKRAIDLGEARLEVNPDDLMVISDVALYYSRIGNVDKARELQEKANSQGPDVTYVHYNSALIHMQFGEVDEALAALERAVALNYERQLLRADPAFAALQDDARFMQLVSNKNSG